MMSRRWVLPRAFYHRPTLDVARDLLGKVLRHRTADGTTAGTIVEVEAYIGEDDPACHAAPGLTKRNVPLYGPPGIAYVYLNYGLHYMINAVTEAEGAPAAVLIRALEPLEGTALMQRRRRALAWRRGKPDVPAHRLCSGPGNLASALGITLAQNTVPLTTGPLTIEDRGIAVRDVGWSPRIGIRAGTDRLWRATVMGSTALSGSRTRG